MPIEISVPAKVNLHLQVVGKRPDGYHLLDSLVTFADVGERLLAERADTFSLTIEGPFAASLLQDEDNLILRAARRLAEKCPSITGAAFILQKHVPVASGLGGGSADAAAALKLLLKLYEVSLPEKELHEIALSLGADVPMCLWSRPLRAEGVGEKLKPASLPVMPLVLVNPGFEMPTADVFAALAPEFASVSLPELLPEDAEALIAWLATQENSLQGAATSLKPEIRKVLEMLKARRGCLLARMAGSGATCFGIFSDGVSANLAAKILAHDHPLWWVRSVKTLQRAPEIINVSNRSSTQQITR
jgi:4-diphosphocytidyl-2-C-methyl-D-erythritol kinase